MYQIAHPNSRIMAEVFTQRTLKEISETGSSRAILETMQKMEVHPPDGATLASLFECYYSHMMDNYRCEYVYKNIISLYSLLERHPDLDMAYTQEFNIRSSIADVVVINGTSTVYEIKSEYDSFERLENQLSDYSLVFDKIYLVTPSSTVAKAEKVVPAHVGIIELNTQGLLQVHKEALSNKDNTSPTWIFSCFRKPEYIDITKRVFGELPESKPSRLSLACQELFAQLPPSEAHEYLLQALRQRFALSKSIQENQKKLPSSLTSLFITASLRGTKIKHLLGKLEEPFFRNDSFMT